MAKNSITVQTNINGDGYIFTGSSRQPTPVEISNYCHEKHIHVEGVFIAAVRITGGYIPPEDMRSLELIEFGEHCPVCAKKLDMYGDNCPYCGKPWTEE